VSRLDHRQTADARADVAADASRLLGRQRVVGLQTAVLHRLHGGGHSEMDEAVHVARLLLGDVLGDVETPHLTCELAGERAGVERFDGVDARPAGQQVGPGLGHRVSDGSNATETGHDNAAFGHAGKPFWDSTVAGMRCAGAEAPSTVSGNQCAANQAF
jgi:hypothetical protein